MNRYVVIIEDKNGDEVKGEVDSPNILQEDQLVTVKNYKGTYTSGFILEILSDRVCGTQQAGELNDRS